MRRNWNLCALGYKLVQPLRKIVWRHLKKITIEVLFNPVFPLLEINLKELQSGSERDICSSIFTWALFTMTKIRKQHKCPLPDKCRNKMWSIHTMQYYQALKKEQHFLICDNIDSFRGHYDKWNKSDTENKHYTTLFILGSLNSAT